jgi:hypothetical protein
MDICIADPQVWILLVFTTNGGRSDLRGPGQQRPHFPRQSRFRAPRTGLPPSSKSSMHLRSFRKALPVREVTPRCRHCSCNSCKPMSCRDGPLHTSGWGPAPCGAFQLVPEATLRARGDSSFSMYLQALRRGGLLTRCSGGTRARRRGTQRACLASTPRRPP